MLDEKQPPDRIGEAFGERFEFEGSKFIVVRKVTESFVLAVKAEDETPAPIYLLPASQPGVDHPENGRKPQKSFAPEPDILLWTSGTCQGDPGSGGWAYVRQEEDGVLAIASGYESDTNMARMKIRAVIEGLKALPKRGSRLVVFADSPSILGANTEDSPPNGDLDLRDQMRSAAAGLTVVWNERGASGLSDDDRYSRLAEAEAIHQAKSRGIISS